MILDQNEPESPAPPGLVSRRPSTLEGADKEKEPGVPGRQNSKDRALKRVRSAPQTQTQLCISDAAFQGALIQQV